MISAGFDLGTRFIKICLIEGNKIISTEIAESGRGIKKIIDQTFRKACQKINLKEKEVQKKIATGYGADLLKKVDHRLSIFPCLTKAAYQINPEIKTILDLGSLFINIALGDGQGFVESSISNDLCAAGSGKFLETIAQALDIPFSSLSKFIGESKNPYQIKSLCAVFAESEVISQINLGKSSPDLIAGVIDSILSRANTLLEKIGSPEPIFLVGGLTKVESISKFFRQQTGKKVLKTSLDAQFIAAYGAALIGQGR
jgi:predicted CoA-substrate-specific enzyme activase